MEKTDIEKLKEEAKKDTFFFAEVKMFSGKYHIFKTGEDICLCKRYRLPYDLREEDKVYVSGKEKYKKEQDCKICFRKANINIEEKKGACEKWKIQYLNFKC